MDLLPPSPTREARRGPTPASQHSAPSRHSAPAGLPSLGAKPLTEGTGSPAKGSQPSQLGGSEKEEEGDWLSHALSRKKSQGLAREEHDAACKGQHSVGALPSDR